MASFPLNEELFKNYKFPEKGIYSIKNDQAFLENQKKFKGGITAVLGHDIKTSLIKEIISISEKHGVNTAFMPSFDIYGSEVLMGATDVFSHDLCQELKALPGSEDVVHVKSMPEITRPGLIILDMDSTCIQCECIDEIAKAYGVGKEISEITSRAMHGELDFKQSLRRRVGLLKGAPAEILWELRDRLPVMPGFPELIRLLQSHGWKTVIASGGFMTFVNKLKDEYNLTLVKANTFEIKDNILTGGLIGDIVDSSVKIATLKEESEKYSIPMSQTVAIGDGANDLPMINAAGIGFAIHAKPVVREKAPATIVHFGLDAAACLLDGASKLHSILES